MWIKDDYKCKSLVHGFSFRHQNLEGFNKRMFQAGLVQLLVVGFDLFSWNFHIKIEKAMVLGGAQLRLWLLAIM